MKITLMRLFFTRLFVSERKQIAMIADEKSPARISHRNFTTKSLRNEDYYEKHFTYRTRRFGRHIAIQLSQLGHDIMAIDTDEERVNDILPFVTNAQIGDSTNPDF